jgi:hypothetical protein
VRGTLQLQATARIPPMRVLLEVEPSKQSWDGFVLDRIDVLGIVRKIVAKGFVVRLPTEKIKPMAIPIGIEPTISVKGRPVELEIHLAELSIARELIWLGASVEVK